MRIATTPAKCTPHFGSANAVAAMEIRRNGHCFRELCGELNSLTNDIFVEMFVHSPFCSQIGLMAEESLFERTLIPVDSKFAGTLRLANFILYNCKRAFGAKCGM